VSDQTKPKIDKLVTMAQGGDTVAFAQIYDELSIAKNLFGFHVLSRNLLFFDLGPRGAYPNQKMLFIYLSDFYPF